MNTQFNSNGQSGESDTNKYKAMFEEWRQEAKRRWMQEPPTWQRPIYPPHQAYLEYLEQIKTKTPKPLSDISKIPVQRISPTSSRQTDSIDTRHMIADVPTVIQDWHTFASEAGLVPDIGIECSPVTEKHPRVTKALSGKLENYLTHHVQYLSSSRGLSESIKCGVDLYIQDRKRPPLLIELSPAALSFLPVLQPAWTRYYPGPSGPIPLAENRLLETHAVRCWGN